MPKKILIISTVPFANDGITNVIINNYNYIDDSNIKMDFVFPNNPSNDFYEKSNNKESKVFILANRTKEIAKYINQLNSLLNRENYDIVHIHGNSSTMILELYLARKNSVLIRIAHTHAAYTKFPVLNKLLNPVLKKAYTTALAPSEEAGEFLFGKEKFQVIENGINIEKYAFTKFKRKSKRVEFNFKDDDIVIGNIGRLAEEKNQKYLIELLKKLNNKKYKLLLVGTGHLEHSLKKMVNQYELEKQVIFTGVREDVTDILSAMDILIVPSLSEGLGITVIEGQAAELPIFISEHFPKDVKQTNLVSVFKLEEMDELIVNINRLSFDIKQREKNIYNQQMKKSSYNIFNSVEKLKQIYLNERN